MQKDRERDAERQRERCRKTERERHTHTQRYTRTLLVHVAQLPHSQNNGMGKVLAIHPVAQVGWLSNGHETQPWRHVTATPHETKKKENSGWGMNALLLVTASSKHRNHALGYARGKREKGTGVRALLKWRCC